MILLENNIEVFKNPNIADLVASVNIENDIYNILSNDIDNSDNLNINNNDLSVNFKIMELIDKFNELVNKLEKNNDLSCEVKLLIDDIKNEIKVIISGNENVCVEKNNVRFNDLGLPMHPLEQEVAEMLDRVKAGEKPFDGYLPYKEAKGEFSEIKTPVDYLEKYFGKYLNVFNGGQGDWLYQFQLQVIDSKFRDCLRAHLSRKGDNINNVVPNISVKCDKEAKVVEDRGLLKNNLYMRKINTLIVNRGLKTS